MMMPLAEAPGAAVLGSFVAVATWEIERQTKQATQPPH